jgi:WD40 repeat protein
MTMPMSLRSPDPSFDPAAATAIPAAGPDELDAFISYSRRDRTAVVALTAALAIRRRNAWLDADDIPPGAPWRQELGTAIEAADSFVFVISPDSVASAECRRELARAEELGKRLIPVLHRPTPDVPARLASLQYVEYPGEARLELAADELVAAIDTDHEWAREHTHWLSRAVQWDARADDRSLLLRGSDLEAAEHWLARQAEGKQPTPTALQTRYIVASRHGERRRLQILTGAALAALAIALALAAVALLQRGEAIDQRREADAQRREAESQRREAVVQRNQAQSRALAATATGQLDVDAERSMLLALAARAAAPTRQAEQALRQALGASHVRAAMRGHVASVSSAVLSGDGSRTLTGSRDGTARIWQSSDGRPLHLLRTDGPVEAAYDPDDRRVLTWTERGTAAVWDASDGARLRTFRGHAGPIHAAAWSSDGRRVVTAGDDGSARVWDAASGRQLARLEHSAPVMSARFSRDGRHVLTAAGDGARWWAVADRTSTLLTDADSSAAELSPDGSLAFTVEPRGRLRVWPGAGGAALADLAEVFEAAWSPDGETIATGGIDGQVTTWRAVSGEAVHALATGGGGVVLDIGFSPDGQLLAAAAVDGSVHVWETASGQEISVLRGHAAAVNRVAFARDGREVVTASADATARRWDVGAAVVLRGHGDWKLPLAERAATARVVSIALSADGRRALTAGDASARVWDTETGREVLKPPGCEPVSEVFSCLATATTLGHQALLTAAAWAPDGERVVSAGEDGTAQVWDTNSGEPLTTFAGHGATVRDASFSPDGERVVSVGADGTARVWRAADGVQAAVLRAPTKEFTAASFTPDGARVLTAGTDGSLRLWDAATGEALDELRVSTSGEDALLDEAISPDGRLVATAIGEAVEVWDLGSKRQLIALRGHAGLVATVAFSPDGTLVASGGLDATTSIWDVSSGELVAVSGGHTRTVTGVAFSGDGRLVGSSSEDGTARLYTCDACAGGEALVERARSRVTRELSDDERRRYVG